MFCIVEHYEQTIYFTTLPPNIAIDRVLNQYHSERDVFHVSSVIVPPSVVLTAPLSDAAKSTRRLRGEKYRLRVAARILSTA